MQDRIARLWKNGVMFDSEDWLRKITWHTNDLTFEEAFERTGISCYTPQQPTQLPHINR